MTEDSPGEDFEDGLEFEDGPEFEHALGFEPAVTDIAVDEPTPRPAKPGAAQLGNDQPGKDGRGGLLRRKVTGVAVLIAALTTVGGGYALLAPTSGASDTASSSQDIEQGRQLFSTSCITCHGANLQGVQGRGPSLVGVGSASVYFQVSTGRMPAPYQGANNVRKPPKFTDEQARQLGAFVQSNGGGPQVPPADSNLRAEDSKLADGGQLFRLNCASCHGATGRGAPLSAGKIAPGLTEATDTQLYTAMLSGPENMPVFSDNQITPEQKHEIISYVKYLQSSKDPGGAGLARIGPVSEGLLVWTVGLGVLMITILWIGAKS